MANEARRDLDIDAIIHGFTNPDDMLKELIAKASKLKKSNQAEWRRIASAIFGLSTAKGAKLLMPHAVAMQARYINRLVNGRYALNDEGTFWL